MNESSSILDKVLENKQSQDLHRFDPQDILTFFLSQLNDREQEVLVSRFGLDGKDSKTLEVIGKKFGVTRERVRQIETSSIKKLKKLEELQKQLKVVEQVISSMLEHHGGVLEQDHLLDVLLEFSENSLINRAIIVFLLEKLLDSKFDKCHDPSHLHVSWKLPTIEKARVKELVNQILAVVEEQEAPLSEDELVQQVLQQMADEIDEKHLRAHFRISKKLKRNIFGHWGKSDWNSISPKRMNDKVYLVLKHVNKPLHFTEIAQQINDLKFDHKVAYPATVHNELILDKKFVLVGRGIYALSEWGYQPGVVADVIERIIQDAGGALSREQIVDQVLEQRMVSKSTVHLALMNKNRFKKNEKGDYCVIVVAA